MDVEDLTMTRPCPYEPEQEEEQACETETDRITLDARNAELAGMAVTWFDA